MQSNLMYSTKPIVTVLTAREGDDDDAAKIAADKVIADKAIADKAEADRLAAEEEAKKKKTKPTDEEARLLKESMKRKEQLDAAEAAKVLSEKALVEANKRLKEFEGMNPAEIRKLVDAQKKAEEDKLKAAGDWDALKKQMNDAHAAEIVKLTDTHTAEKTQLIDANTSLATNIANLTVGGAFGSSPYVRDELVLTVGKARIVYGGHFEFKDGKVIAFDKPAGAAGRTMFIDGKGEPLGFEDALKKIVDADPDRDDVLRSKLKEGAGSGSKLIPGKKANEGSDEKVGRTRIADALNKSGGKIGR